jgi:proteasome lid subunit RPN8/RPN11
MLTNELKNYSITCIPNEACGFILNDNTFIPTENIAENKLEYFTIDPREFLKYFEDIKAIFHSHPLGQPVSDYDIRFCNTTFLPWVIHRMPEEFSIIYPDKYTGPEIQL